MNLFQASSPWATVASWVATAWLDSQLSRTNCQTFSMTVRSGLFGGGSRVMLGGTVSAAERFHPAW